MHLVAWSRAVRALSAPKPVGGHPGKLTYPRAGISVEYAIGTGLDDRLIPYLRPVGAEIEWLKLRLFEEATRKLRNQSQKSTSFG